MLCYEHGDTSSNLVHVIFTIHSILYLNLKIDIIDYTVLII